jgi:hypothetical protein
LFRISDFVLRILSSFSSVSLWWAFEQWEPTCILVTKMCLKKKKKLFFEFQCFSLPSNTLLFIYIFRGIHQNYHSTSFHPPPQEIPALAGGIQGICFGEMFTPRNMRGGCLAEAPTLRRGEGGLKGTAGFPAGFHIGPVTVVYFHRRDAEKFLMGRGDFSKIRQVFWRKSPMLVAATFRLRNCAHAKACGYHRRG